MPTNYLILKLKLAFSKYSLFANFATIIAILYNNLASKSLLSSLFFLPSIPIFFKKFIFYFYT